MTDQELVRAAAERVMGWREMSNFRGAWCTPEDGAFIHYFDKWNPLTSEADCWAMVDKLSTDFIFWIDYEARADDRRRAIVLACLRAVGVDPGGEA